MKIRADHYLHLVAGYLITIIASTLLLFVLPTILAICLAFTLGVMVGIAKEVIWDYYLGRGTPELSDAIYTAIGAACVSVPQLLIQVI